MMRGGAKPTQPSSGCQVPKGGSRLEVVKPPQPMPMSKNRSTTQEMISASMNGVVVISNNDADISPTVSSSPSGGCRKQLLRADTTGDESCTLKTFVSVVASIESDNLFIFSKLSDEHSSQHLHPTTSSYVPPTRSHSCSDRETRKRLHYKEKLHALAERLAANSAVDRSTQLLTNIMVGTGGENEGQDDAAASVNTQDDGDDDIETKFGRMCGSLRKKLMACTMNICVHDAIIDPEGLIISVTHKNLNCGGEECDVDTESDGFVSEVSSLTDETYHRYQARYRYRYY